MASTIIPATTVSIIDIIIINCILPIHTFAASTAAAAAADATYTN